MKRLSLARCTRFVCFSHFSHSISSLFVFLSFCHTRTPPSHTNRGGLSAALPLKVEALHPVDPSLRYTSVLPPIPTGYLASKLVDPLEVLLLFFLANASFMNTIHIEHISARVRGTISCVNSSSPHQLTPSFTLSTKYRWS